MIERILGCYFNTFLLLNSFSSGVIYPYKSLGPHMHIYCGDKFVFALVLVFVTLWLYCVCKCVTGKQERLYGSVVEHLSCKQKVPSSILGGGNFFTSCYMWTRKVNASFEAKFILCISKSILVWYLYPYSVLFTKLWI